MSTSQRPLAPMRDELIAAFLDGSVDRRQRDELAGRIAADPRARLLLAEAARFLEEEALAIAPAAVSLPSGERVRPERARHPGATVLAWAGALAATLALALTLPGRPDTPVDVDWYAVMSPADSGNLAAHVERGEANLFGFVEVDTPESRSFRVGVAHLDVEIALRSGRGQDALTETLDRLRDLVDVPPPVAVGLQNAAGKPGPRLLGELNAVLSSAVPDRLHYELGRWVEASRIAAATDDRPFFRSASFHDVLRRAQKRAQPQEVRVELEQVASNIESGRPDLLRLERSFEQLARLY
jgi:hypothetical protein